MRVSIDKGEHKQTYTHTNESVFTLGFVRAPSGLWGNYLKHYVHDEGRKTSRHGQGDDPGHENVNEQFPVDAGF